MKALRALTCALICVCVYYGATITPGKWLAVLEKHFVPMTAALKRCQPAIWEDVRSMKVADGIRSAGRSLGLAVPYGAPLSVMDEITARACARPETKP